MWYFKLKCKVKLSLNFDNLKDMPELSCSCNKDGVSCPKNNATGCFNMECIKAIFQDVERDSIKEKVKHELLKCEI